MLSKLELIIIAGNNKKQKMAPIQVRIGNFAKRLVFFSLTRLIYNSTLQFYNNLYGIKPTTSERSICCV
jgi:hypothetical protein